MEITESWEADSHPGTEYYIKGTKLTAKEVFKKLADGSWIHDLNLENTVKVAQADKGTVYTVDLLDDRPVILFENYDNDEEHGEHEEYGELEEYGEYGELEEYGEYGEYGESVLSDITQELESLYDAISDWLEGGNYIKGKIFYSEETSLNYWIDSECIVWVEFSQS